MDEGSNVRVYLSGYADGEGCFCVTFNRSKRHKFGWEIRPSFSVSQNGDRSEVLVIYQQLFGCGTIRPDRSDRTFKFETRSVSAVRRDRAAHAARRSPNPGWIRGDSPFVGCSQREQQEAVRQDRNHTGDERIVCAARKSELA